MVPLRKGVVLRIDAKVCHVEVDGEDHVLPLRGKLFDRPRRAGGRIAVGDRVRVHLEEDGGAIEEILPRTSRLVRARGESGSEQVLAANVSLILVTAAVLDPPFQPGLVDRILAVAEREEIEAVLAITKVDLDPGGCAAAWAELYGSLGYRVFLTSIEGGRAHTPDAFAELGRLLHRNISVLSGASGVGKSSLINTLCPGLDLRVGEMSRIAKGRHTTSHSRLIPLPGGGHVLDTPGVGSFGLFAVDPQEVQFLFRELRPMVGRCDYRNCTHLVEPGCAVRAALETGEVDPRRYASYVAIMDELSA